MTLHAAACPSNRPVRRSFFAVTSANVAVALMSLSFGFGSSIEAQAQNLLVNGDFDSGISGWTLTGDVGAVVFNSSVDALNHPNSGSVLLNEPMIAITGIEQCIPASGATNYRFGIAVRGDKNALFLVEYHDQPNCTGALIGGGGVGFFDPISEFHFFRREESSPVGTQSIRYRYYQPSPVPPNTTEADKAFLVEGENSLLIAVPQIASTSGQTVSFLGGSTGGVSPFEPNYLWDFGDGLTSTEQNPTHTYPYAGTFTAILTVDSGFQFDGQSIEVPVSAIVEVPALDRVGLGVLSVMLALGALILLRRSHS